MRTGSPLASAGRSLLGAASVGGSPTRKRSSIQRKQSLARFGGAAHHLQTDNDAGSHLAAMHVVVAKKKMLRMKARAKERKLRPTKVKAANPFALDSTAIDVALHVTSRRREQESATARSRKQKVWDKETSCTKWRQIRPLHVVLKEEREAPPPSRFDGMVTEPPSAKSTGANLPKAAHHVGATGPHALLEQSRNMYRIEMEIERKRVEVDRLDENEWLKDRSLRRLEQRMESESENFESFVKQAVLEAQLAEKDAQLATDEGQATAAEELALQAAIRDLRKANEKLTLRSNELKEMATFLNKLTPVEHRAAGGDASTYFTDADQLLAMFAEIERRSFFVLTVMERESKVGEEEREAFESTTATLRREAAELEKKLATMRAQGCTIVSLDGVGSPTAAQRAPVFDTLMAKIAEAHDELMEGGVRGGNSAARASSARRSQQSRPNSPRRAAAVSSSAVLAQIETKLEGLLLQMDAMPKEELRRQLKLRERSRRIAKFKLGEEKRHAEMMARSEAKQRLFEEKRKQKPTKMQMVRSKPFEVAPKAGTISPEEKAARAAEEMDRFFF